MRPRSTVSVRHRQQCVPCDATSCATPGQLQLCVARDGHTAPRKLPACDCDIRHTQGCSRAVTLRRVANNVCHVMRRAVRRKTGAALHRARWPHAFAQATRVRLRLSAHAILLACCHASALSPRPLVRVSAAYVGHHDPLGTLATPSPRSPLSRDRLRDLRRLRRRPNGIPARALARSDSSCWVDPACATDPSRDVCATAS